MNRVMILAATAALIALPASAQSIHISTDGKAPGQVRAEVYKAARLLCGRELYGASFPLDEMRACVDGTVRVTLAHSDPSLKLAQK